VAGEGAGPHGDPGSITLSSALTPNPADKFTFGLRTVSWQGRGMAFEQLAMDHLLGA
jgi:hypothetical protein